MSEAQAEAKKESAMQQSMTKPSTAKPAEEKPAKGQQVQWVETNLRSAYANVCHVSSSRSEVVMLFGINEDWERSQQDVKVQLTDRVILSPYAAKRLADLLNNVMTEHEGRFGSLGAA